MRVSRRLFLSLFGLFLSCLGTASSVAAQIDRAPIADEAVQKVVHGPLRHARDNSIPDALFRHLEGVSDLLNGMDRETSTGMTSTPDSDAVKTKEMLLRSKLHEIKTIRNDFRTQLEKTRNKLLSSGLTDQAQALDARRGKVDQRFDRLIEAMEGASKGQKAIDRRRALTQARAIVRGLRDRVTTEAPNAEPVPTFTQGTLTWQKPEPGTAPRPQYLSSPYPPGNLYAFLGDTLLAAVPDPTPTEAQTCQYTAADLGQSQEVQLTQEIRDLAEKLGYSPAKIYQYVYNEIAFEPYYGSLKGSMGALISKAGNDTDQASLLIALLRASNIPARYVKGVMHFEEDPRLLRWVGAKDYYAAAVIMNLARVPASYILNSQTGIHTVEFVHAWVEACVPYGNYRGTKIDQSGHRWIPLDPSFKDKTYQAGIATNVVFDYSYSTSTGYLYERTNDLPLEIYMKQVEGYIKTQPPNFGNNTLQDVGYVGVLLPRTIDILPASLPYIVAGFQSWGPGFTAETAEVPDSHRYKFNITPPMASPVTLSMPDVALKRVTLSFKGATPGDQTTLDLWKNNPDLNASLPCTVNVVPVIKVEAVNQAVGASSMGFCTTANQLTLTVTLADYSTTIPVHAITYNNIGAANYHSLQAYAFQASDRLLTDRAAKLLSNVRSITDPNTNLEETEGEFLHLVGLKYMRHLADGVRRIAELDGISGPSDTHLGLTSTRMKVAYVFEQPFAISREGFVVDVAAKVNVSDMSTGAIDGPTVLKTFRLAGHHASALEAYIWQENARLDAVSAVRGIQFARESSIEVLTITSANQATELPKLTSNTNQALNYPPGYVSSIQNLLNTGYTLTLPRSQIQYQNWTGAVWIAENSVALSSFFVVNGSYSGGWSLGFWNQYVLFIPDLDVGFFYESPPITPIVDLSAIFNSAAGNLGITPYTPIAGDPVNMVTGNMYHVERDLSIKGRGLPIVFERSYNSRDAKDGPLGFGWTHSFNHSLVFKDDNVNGVRDTADTDNVTSSVTWIDGTGSEKSIQVAGTTGGVAIGAGFTAPKGFFFTTTRNADGTYTIREKNGLTYTFESMAGTVNQKAKLLTIKDRNNNILTMGYTGALFTSVTDGLNGIRILNFTYTANRITGISDWTGRTYQYSYDGAGNLTTYKNPLAVAGTQNPVTYTYYSDPQLNHAMRSYTLPRGNGMTFEYYMNGKVFKHFNTLGETSTFTYNDFRRETVLVNERGFTRRYFFDQHGNPTKIIEENGAERSYTYDAVNPMNRIKKREPMGYETQYTYDANGNVITITLSSGATIAYSNFTAFNLPGKIKDARGNYTLLKYDTSGNLLQTIKLKAGLGAGLDPVTYTPNPADLMAWTIKTYGGFGNVLSTKQVRDFAGQVGPTLEFDYTDTANNVSGLNVTTITRRGDKTGDGTIDSPDVATLAYDALGRILTGIRADWYPTQFVYDAVDRVTRGTDAVGNSRDYAYDANGNPVGESLTVGSSLLDQMSATYDQSDRKERSINAGGFVTAYRYDAAGNVITITNPDNYTVGLEYDSANRVIKAFDELGRAVTKTLDLDGKPRSIKDPNGSETKFEYYGPEREGRLKARIDPTSPTGRRTTFDYDNNGNVISVTDNLGRITTTAYDESNRPVRIRGSLLATGVYPVTCYTYSTLGFLTQVRAGSTTASSGTCGGSGDTLITQMTYQYDDFGRRIKETDGLGKNRLLAYDLFGNVAGMTDAKNQTTTFTYGYGHKLLTKLDAWGRYTSYIRNALGQVLTAQAPGSLYSYIYDAAHRVTSVIDGRGDRMLRYSYSPGGLLNSLQDNEGRRTDYQYDRVGRLSNIWTPNGDVVELLYDAGGRLVEKNLASSVSNGTGVNTRYAYNPDNTLQQVVNKSGANLMSQHDYTYDDVGNRQAHAEQVCETSTSYAYTYDVLNRLTEVKVGGVVNESYTYDALGNRLTKTSGGTTLNYVYDLANQLNKIQQGGADVTTFDYDFNGNLTNKTDGLNTPTPTTTALSYDPLDQMVTANKTWEQPQTYQYDDQGRRISKSVGGKVTNYVYNGQDIIAEYTGTWNQAAVSYTHGGGTDTPLIRTTGAATPISQYYHQDGLGSVTAVTDQTGGTVGTVRNDAWGNKLSGNGGIPQYGFTGREPDETGLVFYRGRYYDSAIGRFIQRDPIGMQGGMNLYAYVGNNPTNFTDPMGLLPHEIGTLNIETANILPFNTTTPGLDSANQSLAMVNEIQGDSLAIQVAVTPNAIADPDGFIRFALNTVAESPWAATQAGGQVVQRLNEMYANGQIVLDRSIDRAYFQLGSGRPSDQIFINPDAFEGIEYLHLPRTLAHEGTHAVNLDPPTIDVMKSYLQEKTAHVAGFAAEQSLSKSGGLPPALLRPQPSDDAIWEDAKRRIDNYLRKRGS